METSSFPSQTFSRIVPGGVRLGNVKLVIDDRRNRPLHHRYFNRIQEDNEEEDQKGEDEGRLRVEEMQRSEKGPGDARKSLFRLPRERDEELRQ